MEFKGMDIDDNMIVRDSTSSLPKILSFKLLHICEFTSTRKRMSIIVKDNQKNQIVLMCKGADSIVRDLLDFGADDGTLSYTQLKVDAYANQGLRTLFLA
jgi:magnesium-transporting ATPase (P-type)